MMCPVTCVLCRYYNGITKFGNRQENLCILPDMPVCKSLSCDSTCLMRQ